MSLIPKNNEYEIKSNQNSIYGLRHFCLIGKAVKIRYNPRYCIRGQIHKPLAHAGKDGGG